MRREGTGAGEEKEERTAAILEKTGGFFLRASLPTRHPRPFRSRGDERDLSPANYNPICDYRRAIVPVVAFRASAPGPRWGPHLRLVSKA